MILFAEEALFDLERIFELNAERDPASALDHIDKVRSAVLLLETHPKIGRPISRGAALRELVISYGMTLGADIWFTWQAWESHHDKSCRHSRIWRA